MKYTILFISFFLLLIGCKESPDLKSTPLALKDLNEIGELVTAEYYGEVIESLKSLKEEFKKQELEKDYKSYYNIAKRYDTRKNRVIREFRKNGYLNEFEYNRLKNIAGKNNRNFLIDILLQKEWDDFKETYSSELENYITQENKKRKNRKNEIVYLGRGWVKAGFDLSKINFKSNIIIKSDTLFIRNFDPIIFDTDINPWLVPGKIEGFDIIKMTGNVSLEEIELVKRKCKQSLKLEAIESGIYEFALSSGEQSLEGLLGLIRMPNSGNISRVEIRPTKYFEYRVKYLHDRFIDTTEYKELKSIFNHDMDMLEPSFSNLNEQYIYINDFLENLNEETYEKWDYNIWKDSLYKPIKAKLSSKMHY